MHAKRTLRSGPFPAIGFGAITLGLVAGLSVILVLASNVDRNRRAGLESPERAGEQACLTRNTVPNMSGHMFLYVKDLCHSVVVEGPTPFSDCAFAHREALGNEDGIALIRDRCSALAGGSMPGS